MMTYDPPPTHSRKDYAVFEVIRNSSLHRDPTAIGLVVKRAWREHPGDLVVVVLVDEVGEEVEE